MKQPQCGDMYNEEGGGAHCSNNKRYQSTIVKKNSYACHIYGLNGHKMMNRPKFVEMHKMFQWKNASKFRRESAT
jgi:hypothetical protein